VRGIEDIGVRMPRRHMTGPAVVRVLDRSPRITHGVIRVRMMRAGQVRVRLSVLRVMMHAGEKAVTGGVVVIFAFQVREVMLRFLGHRADTPLGVLLLFM
jgi:hypothetical protein